ncbi:hypothetical protein ACFR9U_01745 [Halorientalis brevis]|uniref:DUF4383 domain-containing protein n=1 Tax=Halorientalis brevis TaxID=1126241 RepID=A0ABD6C664_9EURY|nr:hypothetical protein [Halorientalis brevis]
MDEQTGSTVSVSIYGLWGLLVLGTLAVLTDVSLSRPTVLGLRFHRVGQLFFFLAFVIGAVGFSQLGYRRYTFGFAFLAAGWGLLFADRLLGAELGDLFIPGLVVLFVIGMALLLVGIVSDEQAQEVLVPTAEPLDDVG